MRGLLNIAATLSVSLASPALAEAQDAGAKSAVEQFMAAFNSKDAETMSSLANAGAMVTVIEEQDGEDRLQSVPLEQLITNISSASADLSEPIWDMTVMQEGPVATVVARFEFLIDGQRSHCGTNIFNLVRFEGEWKIASIAYSHIEEGCLAAPAE